MSEANESYNELVERFVAGDDSVTEADCLAAKDRLDGARAAVRASFLQKWGDSLAGD